MHVGHSCFIESSGFRPEQLAVELEERGFESFWLGEHTHLPVVTEIPDALRPTDNSPAEVPDSYKRLPDPLVTLAYAAAATNKIGLGTGVSLVLERELLGTAKAVATLDKLSNGRFIFGIGTGWNEPELASQSKVPWKHRYIAARDFVTALRTIWTEDTPSHSGPFFQFDPLWSYPKPAQQNGPHILLGVVGPLGIRHAAQWADGWLPANDRLPEPEKRIALYRALCEEAGRPGEITMNVRLTRSDGGWPPIDTLRRYRDLRIERVVLIDDPRDVTGPDERLRLLDHYATAIPELSQD